MALTEKKAAFEKTRQPAEAALLTFRNINGFDVYNCSIPFTWQGNRYIYGRVEKREETARSWAYLFMESGKDEFTLVNGATIYQLEDPFVSKIGGEIVMGGTHVRYSRNKLETYCCYFYRGTRINELQYFTTGPDNMKDVRLVELDSGIGVFSRPRGREIEERYGSLSMIGFTVISSLDELDAAVVAGAEYIPDLFGPGEWGGCNQCYLLSSGHIGIIGHKSYEAALADGQNVLVYVNESFVFDIKKHCILDEKVLATRVCYPAVPAKYPSLVDCTFSSGIVVRDDGKADLYSGLGDVAEGRIVIDDPFAGFGSIVTKD
ncbi:MAG: DUF1861 family protein [Treponema sp.]|jgi:hypothetical protein|nr:DUF1861 family protein [Treponema sp.]